MEENYAFLYNKEEKGKKKRVWVRCLVMGDLLAIGALDLKGQEEAPYKVQIKYVSIM
jgi:proteasome inhibitor subunit 1 (PI31)